MKRPPHSSSPRGGFTLAEVAVTLLIVGMCLMYVLQGLHTYQKKVAREMATLTLGHIESGLYWEELEMGDDMIQGSYAEEGYEDYFWEVLFGDDVEFSTRLEEDLEEDALPSDTYQYRQEQLEDHDDYDEDAAEDTAEPFEKVRVRVELRTKTEERVLITMERWIPWELVYGEGEEDGALEDEEDET